ncbi:hypothetical protein [Candidatus Nitrosotenuis sp. DW1]|uniref:hypothetical protein n=1 Tax=Candidatus Nitrosotenuis sp. DW1 TaxID=2259672 RepID=UPI0015C721D7|nr:hypothetical protein [Candidatus Nitrosotenuis sp. DW1]QLH09321.1 hypothetical protein DSQ19_07390 [Candidatus Nitrosotenuis sp. DW1]
MQVNDAKVKNTEWETLDGISDGSDVQPAKYFSVCDIWKESVHKIITKTEYQTPIYLQAYSLMHSEFLHSIDNLFGTCYIWQKRYFDRMGIDKKVINAYGELCEKSTDSIMEWMDAYANYKKLQSDVAIDYMKTGNNYLRWWTDMCGKMMSFWNF